MRGEDSKEKVIIILFCDSCVRMWCGRFSVIRDRRSLCISYGGFVHDVRRSGQTLKALDPIGELEPKCP
jgi:hypothetical protein